MLSVKLLLLRTATLLLIQMVAITLKLNLFASLHSWCMLLARILWTSFFISIISSSPRE
nr:MAG TPA: hypothetical protein [Caudoviricetes sp.]